MSAIFEVKQAKLLAYKLPLIGALNFKGHSLSYREGLILQLHDKNGDCRFGEIAPLPGFSRESFQQARMQIIKLLRSGIDNLDQHRNLYPSVQFALDNALNAAPLGTELCTETANLDIIPLLQGSNESVIEQYLSLNNPPIIKLKVARQNVQYDVLLFNRLSALNPHLQLRCDANQAWQKTQASYFFSHINTQQLDYIEEPTASYPDNLQLAKKYRIGLALDETLHELGFHYQHQACIKALILKPMLIGSLSRVQKFIKIAKEQQLQVNISSCFESIIGLLQLTHLAHSNSKGVSISLGLDTIKYFQPGLLTDADKITRDVQALECIWKSD